MKPFWRNRVWLEIREYLLMRGVCLPPSGSLVSEASNRLCLKRGTEPCGIKEKLKVKGEDCWVAWSAVFETAYLFLRDLNYSLVCLFGHEWWKIEKEMLIKWGRFKSIIKFRGSVNLFTFEYLRAHFLFVYLSLQCMAKD